MSTLLKDATLWKLIFGNIWSAQWLSLTLQTLRWMDQSLMIGNLHSKKAQRFTMRLDQHGERDQKTQSICAIKMRPTPNRDGFTQIRWLTFIRCHHEKQSLGLFNGYWLGALPLYRFNGLFRYIGKVKFQRVGSRVGSIRCNVASFNRCSKCQLLSFPTPTLTLWFVMPQGIRWAFLMAQQ